MDAPASPPSLATTDELHHSPSPSDHTPASPNRSDSLSPSPIDSALGSQTSFDLPPMSPISANRRSPHSAASNPFPASRALVRDRSFLDDRLPRMSPISANRHGWSHSAASDPFRASRPSVLDRSFFNDRLPRMSPTSANRHGSSHSAVSDPFPASPPSVLDRSFHDDRCVSSSLRTSAISPPPAPAPAPPPPQTLFAARGGVESDQTSYVAQEFKQGYHDQEQRILDRIPTTPWFLEFSRECPPSWLIQRSETAAVAYRYSSVSSMWQGQPPIFFDKFFLEKDDDPGKPDAQHGQSSAAIAREDLISAYHTVYDRWRTVHAARELLFAAYFRRSNFHPDDEDIDRAMFLQDEFDEHLGRRFALVSTLDAHLGRLIDLEKRGIPPTRWTKHPALDLAALVRQPDLFTFTREKDDAPSDAPFRLVRAFALGDFPAEAEVEELLERAQGLRDRLETNEFWDPTRDRDPSSFRYNKG